MFDDLEEEVQFDVTDRSDPSDQEPQRVSTGGRGSDALQPNRSRYTTQNEPYTHEEDSVRSDSGQGTFKTQSPPLLS